MNWGNADYNILTDVAYDHIEINAEMMDAFSEADCVCFGTLVQRYGISKNTLRELIHGSSEVVKFLDINLRKKCYTATSIDDSLRMTNILENQQRRTFGHQIFAELKTIQAERFSPGNH